MGADAGSDGAGDVGSTGGAASGPSKLGIWSKIASSGSVAGVAAKVGGAKIPAGTQAVGGAAGGAAFATGAGGISRVYEAIDDPGFRLFLGGLLTFFWADSMGSVVALMFATLFMFYTTISIFKGRGLVVVLAFFIMYIYFGGRFSIDSLWTVILPVFVIAMVIRGLMSKWTPGGETFVQGIESEWLGLVSVAFFFIDIGLIDFLASNYNVQLPVLAQNVLYFTPWWAFVGLFATKKSNALINISKVLAVLWIFVVVFMLTPLNVYGSEVVPGVEKLLQAKADARASVSPENQFKSMAYCIANGKLVGGLSECVQIRQRESEWEALCKAEQPDDVTGCVAQQKMRYEQGLDVRGVQDTEITEYTTAEITIDDKTFPKQVRAIKGDFVPRSYIMYLKIKNPFEQLLTVRGSCSFVQARKVVPGELLIGGSSDSKSSGSKIIEVPISCTPLSDTELNGAYTMSVSTIIEGLRTTSYLKRAFVNGKYKAEQIAVVRDKVLASEFSSSADYVSKSPKEFARLNFGFGSTEKDPVIEPGEPLIFVSSIESTDGSGVKGRLEKIHSYSFNVEGKGFSISSGSDKCFSGDGVLVWPGRSQPLSSCFVTLPSEYTDFFEPYLVETFEGELVYDYNLTKEIPIRVDLLDPATMKPIDSRSGSGTGSGGLQ